MKYDKICRTLALAIIVALVVAAISATPALAAPVITLSPTSGAIGTEVTVTGTNFDSYRGDDNSIFFNDVEIANSPLTVPDTGSFSVNFNIPSVVFKRLGNLIGDTQPLNCRLNKMQNFSNG